MQFAALEATQTLAETRFQSVQPLDQRTREVIQQFALAGEAEAAAAALEQRHAHVASQGLQLQSDRRLAERKSVVQGKRVAVRVDHGGRRIIKKKKTQKR